MSASRSSPTMTASWRCGSTTRPAARCICSALLSGPSRAFHLAHQIALLGQSEAIEQLIGQANFTTEDAKSICRVGLANYFAGALVMPYRAFATQARAVRHDIEQLQSRFGVSFEQVCHRLSTLQRPGARGVPFYFVRVDMAGNITKRHSATRFHFARFGGACPLWNVHEAFAQPGKILVQLARMPDNVAYICVARSVTKRGRSLPEAKPPVRHRPWLRSGLCVGSGLFSGTGHQQRRRRRADRRKLPHL